jgi:hypothetical protein
VRGNPQALFGKRPTEKNPAKGTSPAVDFTLRGPGRGNALRLPDRGSTGRRRRWPCSIRRRAAADTAVPLAQEGVGASGAVPAVGYLKPTSSLTHCRADFDESLANRSSSQPASTFSYRRHSARILTGFAADAEIQLSRSSRPSSQMDQD